MPLRCVRDAIPAQVWGLIRSGYMLGHASVATTGPLSPCSPDRQQRTVPRRVRRPDQDLSRGPHGILIRKRRTPSACYLQAIYRRTGLMVAPAGPRIGRSRRHGPLPGVKVSAIKKGLRRNDPTQHLRSAWIRLQCASKESAMGLTGRFQFRRPFGQTLWADPLGLDRVAS